MRDEGTMNKELIVASDIIDELVELRRRLAELEASKSDRKRLEAWSPPKIGAILTEMGYVTESQLGEALRKQEQENMRGNAHIPIGTILVRSNIITEQQLREAIEEQLTRLRGRFH